MKMSDYLYNFVRWFECMTCTRIDECMKETDDPSQMEDDNGHCTKYTRSKE